LLSVSSARLVPEACTPTDSASRCAAGSSGVSAVLGLFDFPKLQFVVDRGAAALALTEPGFQVKDDCSE